MRFGVHGPFPLARIKPGLIDKSKEARSELWDSVNSKHEGLSQACGCYVFAIRSAGGIKPWYIGKAEKQPFEKECLSLHKLIHYDSLIARKGTRLIYLIPKLTNTGKLRAPTTSKIPAIHELESILIGMALARNPLLLNIKGTKMLKNLVVEGFLNQEKKAKTRAAKDLCAMLGDK